MTVKWKRLLAELTQNNKSGQRPGQAAFNALASTDRTLAQSLQGTTTDPYNNDSCLPAFWRRLDREMVN